MTLAEAIFGGALLLGGIAVAARYIADREPGPQPQRTKPDQSRGERPGRSRRRRRRGGKRITTSTVTENGTVFLMGLVTPDEGRTATEIARGVDGVQRVVKLFEYVN